ncbi:MAG TPA: hypothetical protein VFM94_07220 [Solirubrobacterales bacterium]|nr:hypothetical protein [Solirubrobacterales bacterium]
MAERFASGLLPVGPFSRPDAVYDSSMVAGAVVEHTTSWLTINPVKGCNLGCAYCFRARWHPEAKPSLQHDVTDAVEELLRHPEFVRDRTPVSINVSSTDAMLPTVRATTLRAVELLDDQGLRNPVGITTKLRIHDEALEFLGQLRNVQPIVFVSLALLPRRIEPVPVTPRVENLRRLAAAGIPCVLYLRPIVTGWNDSRLVIERLLRLGERYCEAVCVGGLRLSPEIERELASTDVEMPSGASGGFHEKAIPAHVEEMIDELREQEDLTVPIYKHTSCAVSKIMGWPNYNALFEAPSENCVTSCPKGQEERCRGGSI